MKPLRPFVPPLAALLMAAAGGAAAQSPLIDNSEIRFVSKPVRGGVDARFRKWKANVDLRPQDLAASKAEIEIDLASLDLANEESAAELERPGWFDTEHHPVARFASTAIRGLGHDRYAIEGTLSLKGVTRDVVLPVALHRDAGGNSVAEGQLTLNRQEFHLGDDQPATLKVGPEVMVRLRMVLPRVG
jgi:polyisoprenoid-binding protein YceI